MHMLKLATVYSIYCSESKVIKQRVMHFFCNSYGDNICPPLSSPMVCFSINLYGENLRNRPICSHRHNAKEKLNTCKKFSIIISNIKYVISISMCTLLFSIDNDPSGTCKISKQKQMVY